HRGEAPRGRSDAPNRAGERAGKQERSQRGERGACEGGNEQAGEERPRGGRAELRRAQEHERLVADLARGVEVADAVDPDRALDALALAQERRLPGRVEGRRAVELRLLRPPA